jgi:hypothetical protein
MCYKYLVTVDYLCHGNGLVLSPLHEEICVGHIDQKVIVHVLAAVVDFNFLGIAARHA